jgi:hypothetical protein
MIKWSPENRMFWVFLTIRETRNKRQGKENLMELSGNFGFRTTSAKKQQETRISSRDLCFLGDLQANLWLADNQ